MSNAFGVSTFLWTSPFRDERLDLAGHAHELGFDVLEVCLEEPALVTADNVGRAAEEAGVAVSVCGAFGPDRDLSADEPERRRLGLDYLKGCIDLAVEVGSPHVVGPMYSAVGKTRQLPDDARAKQRRWAGESLREAGEYAGERGVSLALEPLNRFETDLVNTVEQGLALCEDVGLENVGLLLDTFHMNIEERSLPNAIRLAGPRLLHFHACENDRGTPGSGHVDWHGVAVALREIRYGGQIVIESFTPEVKEIARAVSAWRPVAPSPDALAAGGLAFLHDLLPAVEGSAA